MSHLKQVRIMLVKEPLPEYISSLKAIKTSDDAYKSLIRLKDDFNFHQLAFEVFGCLFLDTKNSPLGLELGEGAVNESRVYIAETAKKALLLNASSVIIFHNHPSGNMKVSDADLLITQKIIEALKLFSIDVLDHIIFSGENDDYISMKEQGII